MIAIVICLVGLLLWYLATRPSLADGMIAEASKWAFILGLAACLWQFGGRAIL